MTGFNPHEMTADEIAAQVPNDRLVAGIVKAQRGVMTGKNTAGWTELLRKLNSALRIQLGARTIQTAKPAGRGQHRGLPASEFVRMDTDGLAVFNGFM